MPFFQGGGGHGSVVNVRPPQRAAPPPKPFLAGLGRALANTGGSIGRALPSAPVAHHPFSFSGPRTDAQTSGPGYGSARANAFKSTVPFQASLALAGNPPPRMFQSNGPATPKTQLMNGLMKATSSNPFNVPSSFVKPAPTTAASAMRILQTTAPSLLTNLPAFATGLKTPAGTGAGIKAAIALANTITNNHYNYEWGGGHAKIGVPNPGDGTHGSGPGTGFDCSGAVSALLHSVGKLNTPLVAQDFMSYGQAGPGKGPNDITIYASPDHVFSKIGNKYFGTSSQNPGGGAAWFASADTSGFVARHVSLPPGKLGPPVVAQPQAGAQQVVSRLVGPQGRGAIRAQAAQLKAQGHRPMPMLNAQSGGGQANNPSGPPVPQNVSPAVFAVATLKSLGIKPTSANTSNLVAWMQAEGGHWNNGAHFNPLNTTQGAPGATSMNGVGVKAYTSWQQGLQATVRTLKNGAYGGILSALQSSAPLSSFAGAVTSSPWGTQSIGSAGSVSAGQVAQLARQVNGLPSTAFSGSAGSGGSGLGSAVSSGGSTGGVATGTSSPAGTSSTVPQQQSSQQSSQQAQQNALLSQFLSSQSSSPWDIGPKLPGFGGSSVSSMLGLNSGSSPLFDHAFSGLQALAGPVKLRKR